MSVKALQFSSSAHRQTLIGYTAVRYIVARIEAAAETEVRIK